MTQEAQKPYQDWFIACQSLIFYGIITEEGQCDRVTATKPSNLVLFDNAMRT